MSDIKSIRKTLRFSEDEYQKIENELLKNGVTFSDFARSAILRKKLITKYDKEMIYHISKIGNNLNQVARAINSHELTNSTELMLKLLEIERALNDL